MANASLQQCVSIANQVEQAVLDLGVLEGPLASLPTRCAAFRRACESLAANRGMQRVTIAFIGPRNAGKTTLAGLLVRDDRVHAALPCGWTPGGSTRRILWVGPERPGDLDATVESWIPCRSESFEDAGTPFQIADVPGFNDRDAAVRQAAERALETALVKVLVVDERDLEAVELRSYAQETDGAIILPVINRSGEAAPEDVAAFLRDLRATMPRGEILDSIVIPDFNRQGVERQDVLENARLAIVASLRTVLARGAGTAALAAPQLQGRLEHFRSEVQDLARAALPATAAAVRELDEAEQRIPREVLSDVLGPDRALRAILRQRFRSIWVDNTPGILFPWRLVLAIANIAWGALDRVPLLLLGSVPSLISTAWVAMKNLRDAAAFREATTQGLRRHVEQKAVERLTPLVQLLEESLAADLGRRFPDTSRVGTEARVEGIGTLQERSTEAISASVERRAPGPVAAVLSALVGFVLFWSVAGWPLFALYQDYFRAAAGTWEHAPLALERFPSPGLSQLLTSALLGLLPMAIWLLLVAAWVTRSSRTAACTLDVHRAHEGILAELLGSGLLRVRLDQRELAACRRLLSVG
jgi:hypothetical protein